MKKLNKILSIIMCLALLSSMSVFTGTTIASAAKTDESSSGSGYFETSVDADKFSWDNASVYFLLTDRFYNGNTSNDHSYNRGLEKDGSVTTKMKSNAGSFQGGDFAGVTKKINEGYFDDLGINALWVSAPYEQIMGYVCTGNSKSSFPHYSYHGYYVSDYSEFDQNFGTEEEFQTMVNTAHQHGIRIVLDIVMNHAGYNTMYDMNELGFGSLKQNWDTEYYTFAGNNNTYHNYIVYNDSGNSAVTQAWSTWWGSDWIRAGINGYSLGGSDDQTKNLSDLPDFKTESTTTVSVPTFLQNKWKKAGTYDTKMSEMNNWFSSNNKTKRVRNYICYWLSQYVEKYGVDGFRCDTAKHVELDSWKELSEDCTKALNTWRANNKGKDAAADWTEDFWMTGENYGQGVDYNSYYQNGFESMINFSFTGGGGVPSSSQINSTYSSYANSVNTNDNFNVLTYISSHDTKLCGRNENSSSSNQSTLIYQGSAFQLLPGGIQIYYGDESARPYAYDSNSTINSLIQSGNHDVRSFMNWDSMDKTVLAHWQKVGTFRNNHIAVGAGSHTSLTSTSGVAFERIYDKNNQKDKVMCVIAANSNTNVTITVDSTYFKDGETLTNAYTGDTATISGGKVTFNSGANGTILCETTGSATPSYSVTNTLSNVSTNNSTSKVTENDSYEATITANANCQISSVKVTMGGTDITSSAYSNGKISIAAVTGDVVITASASKIFTVQNSLSNAVTSNNATTVTEGSSYTAKITAKDGYQLKSSNIMVFMGSSSITASSDGTITIPNVTDNIIIMATASQIPTSASSVSETQPTSSSTVSSTESTTSSTVSSTEGTSSSKTDTTSSNNNSTQPQVSPVVTTVTAAAGSGILLGDANLDGKIDVKDALLIQKYAIKLAVMSSDQILASDVDGDGKVTVKDALIVQKYCIKIAVDQPVGQVISGSVTPASSSSSETSSSSQSETPSSSQSVSTKYTITSNILNINSSNNATEIESGEVYSTSLTAASGYEITRVVATMNGEEISVINNGSGVYLINCVVTGDIVITGIATKKEDPQPSTSETTPTQTTQTTPTNSTGDTFTFTLVDGTTETWLDDYSPVFVVEANGQSYTMSGYGGTWTVDLPKSATSITINRNDAETGETYNKWGPLTVSGTTYTATGDGTGSWNGSSGGNSGNNGNNGGNTGGDTSGDTFTFTLVDGTPETWLDDYSPVFVVEANGQSYTMSGYGGTWTVDLPKSATTITINRNDPETGETYNQWGPLTVSGTTYTATASGEGNWNGTSGGSSNNGGNSGSNTTTTGTVKFTNSLGWSSVYAYFYNTAVGDIDNVKWPGTQLTDASTNDYGQTVYTANIPDSAEYVIFNDGGSNQTVNIALDGSEGYWLDGSKTGDKYNATAW
jgi:alpha-amylase